MTNGVTKSAASSWTTNPAQLLTTFRSSAVFVVTSFSGPGIRSGSRGADPVQA
jgi:hypothetical protein